MKKLIFILIITIYLDYVYGQVNILKSPITLNSAIEFALNNNPQIKISTEKINAINGKFWSNISIPQPTVSFSYEYTPIGKSLNYFSEKTFEINQSFNFPTYYYLRGAGSLIEKETSEQEDKLLKFNFANQVKTAYFNVLAKLELCKIAEENLTILQNFSHKTEIKYKAGEGTNIERLTAKIQSSEAFNLLENANNQLKTAINDLSFLMGLTNEVNTKEFIFADSLKYFGIPLSLEEATAIAEKSNLKSKLGKLNVEKYSNEKALAWTSVLPNFNISYFKQTRDGNSDFYGALFGISIPLWFFMDQKGQIQEASASYRIAEYEQELSINLINIKVKNYFLEFKDAEREVLFYQNEILPQSYEVDRAAEKSYSAGESTYLEYLQAKQILISTRSNYINALFKYNLSLLKLEESIGKNLVNY